jgi:hypothetical protein
MNQPSEKTIRLLLTFMKNTSLPRIIEAQKQKEQRANVKV